MMEQEYNTGKNKPEYAVKPHHRLKRLGEGGPSMLKVRPGVYGLGSGGRSPLFAK